MKLRTPNREVEDDVYAQVKRLRAQMETLVERAPPAVAEAVRVAGDAAREQVDAMSDRVRAQPLGSVVVAAAAGYVLGRLMR